MEYTVKRLSKLACVSVRTLHYYDEIGLLKPASYGDNGYRYYDDEAVLRLQQILFFKELDFSLDEIQQIIDKPGFDMLHALQVHKLALQQRVNRLNNLIHTVDQTILHLEGQKEMIQTELFEGFTEEKQKAYEQIARDRYGERAEQSIRRWNNCTKAEQDNIKSEGVIIYRDLVSAMPDGYTSQSVQAIIARWHQHLRYFYEPSLEQLRGLAHLYNDDPDFIKTFTAIHPELPAYLEQALLHYCEGITDKSVAGQAKPGKKSVLI